MATNGTPRRDTRPEKGLIVGDHRRVLVFGLGYLLGTGDDERSRGVADRPTTPAPTSETSSPTPTDKPSPTPSAIATAEPGGDTLPDGRYFVQLTDIQGGEEGPLLLQYDLAYFLTGEEANQAAEDRGLETPGAQRLLHRERQSEAAARRRSRASTRSSTSPRGPGCPRR